MKEKKQKYLRALTNFFVTQIDGSANKNFIEIQTGGIGEAVRMAFADERDIVVKHLAVQQVPRSGKPAELLAKYGIDAKHICVAVKEVLKM